MTECVELHADRCGGCTSAKALWENARSYNQLVIKCDDEDVSICTCCTEYVSWKKSHPNESKKLQQYADKPFHYITCHKKVTVVENGEDIVYTGTIYSTKCGGIACTNSNHPHICPQCFELTCGKSSALLRKTS